MLRRKKFLSYTAAALTLALAAWILFGRGLPFAPSATASIKTPEQYWAQAGLQPGLLNDLLSPESCEISGRQFLACANAVSMVAQKYGASVSMTGVVTSGVDSQSRQIFAERELLKPWQKQIDGHGKAPSVPFAQAWKKLLKDYIPAAQQGYAIGMGINAFLSVAQDPHTYILPGDYYNEVISKSSHRSISIGLVLGRNDQNYFVKKVVDQSSAESAGVKKGDVILELNGKSAQSMSPFEISDALKGESGTTLHFKLVRGKELLQLSVVRSERNLQTVSVHVLEGIKPFGVLTINKFASGTCTAVKASLESLRTEGIAGLLVDLRDNPGGQMAEAACVTGLFLGPGKKVFEIKLLGETEPDEVVYSDQEKVYAGPIAVLVNSGSASAAEILAGALRDHHRAVLVGERTFGKGSFQEGRVWAQNKKMVIFQTKGFYFLPSGFTPQLVGLEPDVKVSFKDKFALRESEQFAFPLRPLGNTTVATSGTLKPSIAPDIISCISYESEFIAPGDPEIQEAHRILNCRGIAGRGE